MSTACLRASCGCRCSNNLRSTITTCRPRFTTSAQRLAAKYSEFGPIPTLCGRIDEAFLARR